MKIKLILPVSAIAILLGMFIIDLTFPTRPVTRLLDTPENTVLRFQKAVDDRDYVLAESCLTSCWRNAFTPEEFNDLAHPAGYENYEMVNTRLRVSFTNVDALVRHKDTDDLGWVMVRESGAWRIHEFWKMR